MLTVQPIALPKPGLLEISQADKLVTYLSSLSLPESKIEAANWILEQWGISTVNLSGSAEWLLDNLKNDYQLISYEMSGNISRLIKLNYPAILEITLPNAQGTKYLALLSISNHTGTFGSVDRIEMPISTLEQLWNGKAIILWKDFENLPPKLSKGLISRG